MEHDLGKYTQVYGEDSVFVIPERNIDNLNHNIEKLNRRATKLGVPNIELKMLELVQYEEVINRNPSTGFLLPAPVTVNKVEWIVAVLGEAPKLNGWELRATLEHVDNTCLVHCVPGYSVPTKFRKNTSYDCDHCGKMIRRKETHVVYNADSDEYKAVGSGCIKDFLGHRDPKSIARWYTWFSRVMQSFKDEEEYFGENWNPGDEIGLELWLSFVCESVIRNGWLSKSKFEANGFVGQPTTWDALDNYIASWGRPDPNKDNWIPSDEAKERAKKIVTWAREKFGKVDSNTADEYHYNLKMLVNLDFVTRKNQAIVASLAPYYWREQEALARKAAMKDKPSSKYFAEIKDRIEISAEVISIKEWNGDWGVAYIHNFLTEEGNQVCWWGSHNDMEPGKKYKFKATVKKLAEWNDQPQTVVTRVTSIKEI